MSSISLPIIVYGGGEVFAEYFNAIAILIGDSTFKTIWHIAALLGGMTFLYSMIMDRNFYSCARWFMTFYIAFTLGFTAKISIEVLDRTDADHTYKVDNVPIGLAMMANISTTIGDGLTRMMDKIFSLPDGLRYSKSGFIMASRMAIAASQFKITNANFDSNMKGFMQRCVFYDIELGKYSVNDLVSTENVWQFVTQKASPARAFIYNGKETVCRDGVSELTKDWNVAIGEVMTKYGSRMFPESKNAKAEMIKYLPISYGYLANILAEVNQIVQQNMMYNIVYDSTKFLSDAAANAQEQQKSSTFNTLGMQVAYWLQITKNVLEAIMYGCFIFVILLGVFPFGIFVAKNYAYALAWLQTWGPLYAIINLMCSYYVRIKVMAATGGALTLQNIPAILQINQDIASIAGYLAISVPFIAAILVRGMALTITQLSLHINGTNHLIEATTATQKESAENVKMSNMTMNTTNTSNLSSYQSDRKIRSEAYQEIDDDRQTEMFIKNSSRNVNAHKSQSSQLFTKSEEDQKMKAQSDKITNFNQQKSYKLQNEKSKQEK